MNYFYYTFFYKINRYSNGKIYRSHVRASALENAIDTLKSAVGYDIDIVDIECASRPQVETCKRG